MNSGMVVIARFPRLDLAETAARSGASVDASVASAIAAGAAEPLRAASDLPTERDTTGVARRPRGARARFPTASTVVLVVIAAVCWAAVWRDEQRRAAEDPDDASESMAMEPDAETELIR